MNRTPNEAGRTGNCLLDRLPRDDYLRLLPHSELVSLPHGQAIYQPHDPTAYVYFPTRGVLSMVVGMEDGRLVEAATVGNEGMAGVHFFLGLDVCPIKVICQMPGEILRVAVVAFQQAMRINGGFEALLRRYAAYSLRFATQTVACNALHQVEERMCRWLLTTQDRIGGSEFLMTHEFLAEMLGVRRQTVTVIAGNLQSAGVISYRRGAVRIVNRARLEQASCECYAVARDLYRRMVR